MHAQRRRFRPAQVLAASLAAIAAITLASCSAESDPDTETNVPVLSTMKKTQSPSDTTGASSGTFIDKTLNGGAPSWNFPLVYNDWTMAPRNEPGRLRLEHSQGCSYTATQQPLDGEGKSDDRAETEHLVEQWKSATAADATDPVFSVEDSDDVRGIGDTKVTTIRADATYTTAAGEPQRTSGWFRAFTTPDKPMAMTLEYDCPADAYNETELAGLLENTRLMNVERAALD